MGVSSRRYLYEIYKSAMLETDNTGMGIVHVQNGRPLTEHGAKLLGIPWNPPTRTPAPIPNPAEK
jgi:hypothetical protein